MTMAVPAYIMIEGAFADWPLQELRAVARHADTAGVGALVLPDTIAPAEGGVGWPDALILIGWLAPATRRIRLLGRISSLGHQPYNLARRLASLDIISGGRTGWLVDDAQFDDAFAAYSGPARLAGVDAAARQREFEIVVQGLWRSWDTDALALDKQGGQFFRPQAMHMLAHEGPHFSVRGPLNVMRSPVGAPLLLHTADVADAVRVGSAKAAAALLAEMGA